MLDCFPSLYHGDCKELQFLYIFLLSLNRIRVKGGGRIAQIYAIRQALAKSLVAYYQKRKINFLKIRFDLIYWQRCNFT